MNEEINQRSDIGNAVMATAFTVPPDSLPADAELVLVATRVIRLKGTIVVGQVVCDELCFGDTVVAVGSGPPICKGRICGWEWLPRPTDVAYLGQEIAIMFGHWGEYDLPQDVRLFRVRKKTLLTQHDKI
jgi:hypothetical protein